MLNWFWKDLDSYIISMLNFLILHQHYIIHHYKNAKHATMFLHLLHLRENLAWLLIHGPQNHIIGPQ